MMTEDEKRNAALAYLQAYHPLITARIVAGGPLNGMGSFWTDLRNKVTGNISSAIKAKVDQITAPLTTAVATGDTKTQAQGAGVLSNLLGPATATALFNLFRIQKGLPPVNLQDVTGAKPTMDALNFLAWATGGGLLLWALSRFVKR